ncbi:MAG TPA: hypothetical protein ENI32_08045 [Candidatus Syntrophoarchaeum butanivorans]|uniref:Uncharacterized protein n=1 Tax=Candidatus Syntropharchaeum butanivorans TaxID=1839936 RepID=A0A7J2S2V9_9EURY|nr:hypothetical protein [Candidatus Syntrophoarchaeum butanivorans]
MALLVSGVVGGGVIVDEIARLHIDDYLSYAMHLNYNDKITIQIQQTAKGLLGLPTVDVYL